MGTANYPGCLAFPGLLALLVFSTAPAASSAESIAFRNETNTPVVLQMSCLVQGRLFRERPVLLRPGEYTPAIRLPGDKLISIYDARMPNLAIFQGAIPGSPQDRKYGIIADVPPPRLKLIPR